MMVVIGIIVLITVIAMPTVGSYFQLSLNSATRDFASVIKQTYNSTVVTGNVHRIVYDLKENTYWTETGPSDALLDTKESKEKEERRKKFARASEPPPPSHFSLDPDVTRKKKSLPSGVEFEDVVTLQSTEPVTTGLAYSHFFPQGVTEQTIVHLKDQSKHHASLIISPLMGITDVYDRYVDAKDIFGK
jgi:general secretion pathway protein H